MKLPKNLFMRNFTCSFLFACFILITTAGFSAPVNPGEATAIANLWYAMELNSGYLKISEAERTNRLSSMANRQVMYLVSADELLEEFPPNRPVLAYIIKYPPHGFVVVSGDDRIEPIMVFSTESEFRWDHPELNFLRYYLGKVMPALWDHMPAQTHRNWSLLRAKLSENIDKVIFSDNGRAIFVLWNTALWSQGNYYNDTCQVHNGGNFVPTGCTATAMAIKMKFHNWPLTGNSSHAYSDTFGDIQYSHSVNYGSQSYNWAAMTDSSLISPNSEVARIMYHSGVAVNMNYELSGSGAWPSASSMNTYFRYRGTVEQTSGHDGPIQTSIVGKLPVVLSTSAHTVLACGYRDTQSPYYYLNCGWNGSSNSWYNLDSIPPAGYDSTIDRSYPYAQPNNWIYIDRTWPGAEDGRIYLPYNTLSEGEAASINEGELLIKTGTYTGAGNVPITFDNEVAIRAYAGDVVIGENVWLMNYEAIKLHGNGQLKITPAKAGK